MGNVVGNPAREHQLTSEAKRKASHVRNQFRTDVRVQFTMQCSIFLIPCAFSSKIVSLALQHVHSKISVLGVLRNTVQALVPAQIRSSSSAMPFSCVSNLTLLEQGPNSLLHIF